MIGPVPVGCDRSRLDGAFPMTLPDHDIAAITTRGEFIEALRGALLQALHDNVRELYWSDVDFVDWPLNEPALIDALTRWARPHHRLLLLAQHYDEIQRRHPRFVQWRRTWSHVVDARSPTELQAAD